MTQRKTRIAVVFGGRSPEHGISCVSAGNILSNLDTERFDIVPVGITPDGAWVLGPDNAQRELEIHDRVVPEVTSGHALALPGDPTRNDLVYVDKERGGEVLSGVDVVFPALHGAYGEDGTIQGLLEMADVPYVGAGVLSSAVSMDKEFTKKLLQSEGLDVGSYEIVRRGQETLTSEQLDRLGLPLFVKPTRAGSSVGVTKVTDLADLDAAIAEARRTDPKVIVESGVTGREIECGVLEFPDGSVEASLPAELRVTTASGWYDFDSKYLDDTTEIDIPAKLDDETIAAVRAAAVRTFRALDCQGLARVDFFVSTDGAVIVNEANTMPGFTTTSMYPQMWAHTGIDYSTLLSTLIDTALARGTGLR